MNRLELETEVVTVNRMTRALWLSIRGLEADKDNYASDEDLRAVVELAWQVHKIADKAETLFFEEEGSHASDRRAAA